MASNYDQWRSELNRFLGSGEKLLVIPYDGPDLNPRRFWHRLIKRSPLRFLLQITVVSLTTYMPAGEFKNSLLRLIGMNIGKDAFIASGVMFDVEFPTLITIGPGAIIGTMTKILTHEVTIRSVRVGRIDIGRQAVIGVGCVLRSGVSIGDGAVVSMQSFVNKDVDPATFAGGKPAEPIKKLDRLV
ncbi:acyltransferase [bacterium]|nr:acyltransferase [bacterium]